jgi:hypothetical protein
MFVAEAGDFTPITGRKEGRNGFQVFRLDPMTGQGATFFKTRSGRLGSLGLEYVTTAGPKRPVDVRFSPEGDALYVADLGAIMVTPSAHATPHPFAGTGVIWRITRDNLQLKSPIGISFIPGKANDAVGGIGSAAGTSSGEDQGVVKKD